MPQEHTKSFLEGAGKLSMVLTEAVNCLAGGIELRRSDERLAAFEPRPGSYTAAAADPDAARAAEECLGDWCKQVEDLLAEADPAKPGEKGAGAANISSCGMHAHRALTHALASNKPIQTNTPKQATSPAPTPSWSTGASAWPSSTA
jgi:hypothetical protein